MIDLPPQEPPSFEETVVERLVECGLSAEGVTVQHQPEYYLTDVTIGPTARASEEHFSCIREATEALSVNFEDAELREAYSEYWSAYHRPIYMARSIERIEELGLAENFPEIQEFHSLGSFIEALEVHAGVEAGSHLSVDGNFVTLRRDLFGDPSSFDYESAANVLAVVRHASFFADFEFGFVGNERYRTED